LLRVCISSSFPALHFCFHHLPGNKFKVGQKLKKAAPKKAIHSKRQSESAGKTYNQVIKPKNKATIAHLKESQQISKVINRNIEKQLAGKVIQAGERLNLTDIKAKGKAHYKEVKQGLMKKKKTGIEEKMAKLKAKLDKIEGKGDPKRKTGNGFLSQQVIDRA
jgi:hypothetical protein